MKLTILFASFATIVGSIFYISKPVNAVGSGIALNNKTEINKAYSTASITSCPVVGNQVRSDGYSSDNNSDDTLNYEHCNACNTGALLPSKEGVIRCSFCGKQKE